jgi:prephenate dehydrogenase
LTRATIPLCFRQPGPLRIALFEFIMAAAHPDLRPDVLAVVGLGAIGGSVAWQARIAGVPHIVGFSPDRQEAEAAASAGAVTQLADSPAAAVGAADLAILATPPAVTNQLISELAPHLERRTTLSDVGSVKVPVIERALAAGLAGRFAGAHPLAGTHGSGFTHARPDLLSGCVVYICSTGPVGGRAAELVRSFWADTMKASPVLMDATAHDRQLAWTSHLPQAVAYALANALAGLGLESRAFGSGARDTMRLAASNPDLWLEIFLQNRDAVLDALDGASGSLARLRALVAEGKQDALRAYLQQAADFRRGLDR